MLFRSFRLLGAPYGLRQSVVGGISLLYLLGIFSSVWAGRRADRLGRRHVLWTVMGTMFAGLLLTLAHNLVLIVAGMAVFTFGFFASHSIASSWVGRRAHTQPALASALYLCFYYLGSSVVGWRAINEADLLVVPQSETALIDPFTARPTLRDAHSTSPNST